MQGQGDPAVVTFVRELETPNVLASFLDDLPGVYDFDQRRFSAGLYRRYRERVMTVVGLGLAAVLGVLLVRYRRVGSAVAAIAPALLAVASTCSVLAVLGESLHIFHLIGLLLVLGMGADYGIFMVERSLHERELGPTLVSVTVACATTVCGFGLLAWSSNPALHALGFTVGVGVLLSLVFAPTTLLLVKVRKPS
jgi:predicted exporter